MNSERIYPAQPPLDSQALLEQTASRLREVLIDLASRLRPFPAFMNMVSLQAMELEPLPGAPADLGCVVVLPGGEISELDLRLLPGIEGVRDVDTVEDLTELDLTVEDYIIYASSAIRLIYLELGKRSR
ncbi:MAG: hypothetical protein BZY75_05720 [SAR202 cluster bacterium Io17-Chloro-G7]|nr:MAG: hypothetical protein BZY75_05720 [SAR202 cluster bacterium Io17-Chloro-G7]